MENEKEIIEKLADYMHDVWGNWYIVQSHNDFLLMNEMATANFDLAARNDERWTKQASTLYKDLSEEDKEKDREFARGILELINDGKKG